jgi:putative GTP pyrophosphokinase
LETVTWYTKGSIRSLQGLDGSALNLDRKSPGQWHQVATVRAEGEVIFEWFTSGGIMPSKKKPKSAIEESGPPDIEGIRSHFEASMKDLEAVADYVSAVLRRHPAVHSIRSRIKDADHLEKKIGRPKYAAVGLNAKNYAECIEDLVGIRVIHLYKHQWAEIHQLIHATFSVKSSVAYVREGDNPELASQFETAGLPVRDHEKGYRSVHYIVESTPGKQSVKVEIQVRTIFEEGWSEIDHHIRYPGGSSDPIIGEFISVFNRFAGGADELASLLGSLVARFEQDKAADIAKQEQLDTAEQNVQDLIEKHGASEAEKIKLKADLETLRANHRPGRWALSSSQIESAKIGVGLVGTALAAATFASKNEMFANAGIAVRVSDSAAFKLSSSLKTAEDLRKRTEVVEVPPKRSTAIEGNKRLAVTARESFDPTNDASDGSVVEPHSS